MPCLLCDNSLHVRPCDHPTGIIDNLDEILKLSLTLDEKKIYIEAIKNLHDHCPCRTCIVRVKCLTENQTQDQSIKSICVEYRKVVNFKITCSLK